MSQKYAWIRDESWNGEARIYRNILTGEGIVVSRILTPRGSETMIFPYSLQVNEVSDWGELYVGYDVTHEEALREFESETDR